MALRNIMKILLLLIFIAVSIGISIQVYQVVINSKEERLLSFNKLASLLGAASNHDSWENQEPKEENPSLLARNRLDYSHKNSNDWDTVQNARRKTVQKACENFRLGSTGDEFSNEEFVQEKRNRLSNIIVDDKNKVLFCYIPMIACTKWKKIFMMLTNQTEITSNFDSISNTQAHYKSGLKFLNNDEFTTEDVVDRILNYKKVLFVRQPMERLLSTYRNQFASNSSDAVAFRRIYAYEMIQYARNSADVDKSGIGMTFEEFLVYLGGHDSEGFHEHWAPYYNLCHPCSIAYDYIGKYETLEEDANAFLEKINAPSKLKFPPYKPTRTKQDLPQILKAVPEEIRDKVMGTFGIDYMLFDYLKDT